MAYPSTGRVPRQGPGGWTVIRPVSSSGPSDYPSLLASTSSAGTCPGNNWISVGDNTSVDLSGLSYSTLYYWQVRARNSQGDLTYANGGTWWSFTTAQALPVSGGTIYLPIIVAAAP